MLELFKNLFLKLFFLIPLFYHVERYPLNTQLDIEGVLFRDNDILFIEESSIKTLDSNTREFLPSVNKPSTSSISLTEDSFLICEWKNYKIESLDEYSTKIWIYILGKKEDAEILELHQTVKPINCSTDVLFLETSIPQLEKKYFEYDIKEEELLEIKQEEKTLVVNSWRNIRETILVKRDIGNIVWVYRKVLKF